MWYPLDPSNENVPGVEIELNDTGSHWRYRLSDVVLPLWVPYLHNPNEGEPMELLVTWSTQPIHGVEVEEYASAVSDFVHKDRLDEANQLLVEAEEDLSEARNVVDELWSCLEDSEAELEEVRTELEETQQALAEVIAEVFELVSGMMDHSDPDFQLLQMCMPIIREKYLKKD